MKRVTIGLLAAVAVWTPTTALAAPPPKGADLEITVTAPATVESGSQANFTLTVANKGPATASATRVSLQVNFQGDAYVWAYSSQGAGCSGTPIVCELGDVVAGGSATVSGYVRPAAEGVMGIRAAASSSTRDPIPDDNEATATIEVVERVPRYTCTNGHCSSPVWFAVPEQRTYRLVAYGSPDFNGQFTVHTGARSVGVTMVGGTMVEPPPDIEFAPGDYYLSVSRTARWSVTIPQKCLYRDFSSPCVGGITKEVAVGTTQGSILVVELRPA